MGYSSGRFGLVLVAALGAFGGAVQAQSDPPGRVGRLAFTEGTVSFHDDQQDGWSPAVVNTPLTTGDAIWTEPNARSELSLAGTRIRLEGGTQIDMLEIDDSVTRVQVDRGRIDIKTFTLDTRTPYQVVTPRGTISLLQQGDYYVEAGSTEDATRLGVRSGAAQIQSLSGETLAVRPGEVGEIRGDVGTPQLSIVRSAPPPPAAYWAARDRQISYDLPAQYLSAGVTGYEDLNAYGSWSNDSEYGQVWTPRSVPAGWQPYRTGHWSYVRPWGWTWIDDQPWGYAPYHYGRWASRNDRWMWVPPQRDVQPVYAPALVAFIGGVELVLSLSNQSNAPVGWFPLGPREVYMPAYTSNRTYYSRINAPDHIQPAVLENRWQSAQRRESHVAGRNTPMLANQRFATVVPADVFVRSQPVARAALRVSAAQIAAAPVAPVSAPPAPTVSLTAMAPLARPNEPADTKARPDGKAKTDAQAAVNAGPSLPVAKTAIADMPTLGRPTAPGKPTAPGPKISTAPTTTTGTGAPNTQGRPQTPALAPRIGSAPPQLHDDKASAQPGRPGATTTAPTPGQPQPRDMAPATPAISAPQPQQHATPAPPAPQTIQPPPTAPHIATPAPQPQQHATPAPPAPQTTQPPPAAPHLATPAPLPQQHATPAPPAPQTTQPPPAAPHLTTPAPQPQQHATPPASMPSAQKDRPASSRPGGADDEKRNDRN